MLVNLYVALKGAWSSLNDWIKGGSLRRPVPVFPSPEAAAAYVIERGQYKLDPAWGAFDFYTHPERCQYSLETGDWAAIVGFDCDDWALWAYAALSKIPGCRPTIYTLRDSKLVGSHVICVYEQNGKFGAIDTNGHRRLVDLKVETLCRVWKDIYASLGYDYVEATPTPYPF